MDAYYNDNNPASPGSDSHSTVSSDTSSSSIRLLVLSKLSDIFWFLILIVSKLILPIVKILILGFIIIIISISASYFIFLSLSPKSLLKEKVYFDFTSNTPSARVGLLSKENQ